MIKKVRTRSPLRLGLAGGGTDISPFCEQHTGYILNATIDKYVYCTLELNTSGIIEFYSADLDQYSEFSVGQSLLLSGYMDLYKAIHNRMVNDYELELKGLNLFTFSEAPMGSGLGGSSTLIVSIIKAYCECFCLSLGVYEIARLAYSIERVDLGWSGGKQDQYAATFGGFNFMEFSDHGHVVVNPLDLKNWVVNELQASSFIGFSGISRESGHVIDDQSKAVTSNSQVALNSLHQLKQDALEMKSALIQGDINSISYILNKSWEAKKLTSKSVTNSKIDEIINFAKENGALACKVSGAGGGGFIYFISEPTKKFQLMKKLDDMNVKTCNFHFSPRGTQAWTL